MIAENWYVNDSSEDTGDFGSTIEGLTIGPHEGECTDSFAFSESFRDGIPDEVSAKFALMAAAPQLLAACKAAKILCEGLVDCEGIGDFYTDRAATELDRLNAALDAAEPPK